jgi:rhodanese-related sulfurtransferase
VARISVAEAAPLCAACTAAFVDSGTPAEFETGHVTGAFHFGPGESAAGLAPRLGSFATVIVYDRDPHCGLADRVAAELAAAGVQGVRVLEGAWPEWMARGAPGESGACSPCQAVKAVAR